MIEWGDYDSEIMTDDEILYVFRTMFRKRIFDDKELTLIIKLLESMSGRGLTTGTVAVNLVRIAGEVAKGGSALDLQSTIDLVRKEACSMERMFRILTMESRKEGEAAPQDTRNIN